MPTDNDQNQISIFEVQGGFKNTLELLKFEIQELYMNDDIPWVIGYSGGKDSTAALQLVWYSLSSLEKGKLSKPVHVISTDTLVENPIVAAWVAQSLDQMTNSAKAGKLPILPNRLTPEINDTFWVNLIGKGYPAPWQRFRWCTDRLKISPSNKFIRTVAQKYGETILVLGTRKAESNQRKHSMNKKEKGRIHDRISPNTSLQNSFIYTPIEDWTNDDVWAYILNISNPWGIDNHDLLNLYKGASVDGECPLVLDINTPSCGKSRFGCYVCTLVDRDKSMEAMIQNDDEKLWLQPLLDLRDDLAVNDKSLRDFRRLSGAVQIYKGEPIRGPYTQEAREKWLIQLLKAQIWIRDKGPEMVRNIELISLQELQEIRRIWVVEKGEFEDLLPKVYENTLNVPYPGPPIDDNLAFGSDELEILKQICGDDLLHYQLIRSLIDVERRYKGLARRSGLFNALEKAFRKNYYDDEEDAKQFALKKIKAIDDPQLYLFEREN